MNCLRRLFRRAPAAGRPSTAGTAQAASGPTGGKPQGLANRSLDGPWVAAGLHTRLVQGKPRLATISAVVVEEGRLQVGRHFHARLPEGSLPGPGIRPNETAIAEAWQTFLGDRPLVIYAEDAGLQALAGELGLSRQQPRLTLSRVLPALYPGTDKTAERAQWLARIGLPPVHENDSEALALAHGQLLLAVLHRARRQQIHDLRGLHKLYG